MIFSKILKNDNQEEVQEEVKPEEFIEIILNKSNAKDYIYTMAEAHAIDLIAKTISKTEIQVLKGNDNESIDDIYWMLNIQPNYNESGSRFLYKLVVKLLVDKSVLVLVNKNNDRKLLYVANTYECDNKILEPKTFYNITVNDDERNTLKIKKKYNYENSIYYCIKNNNLKLADESFKKQTSELVNTIHKKYILSNIPKWRLKKPGGQPTLMDFETGKEISYKEYTKKITDGIFSDEEAVILLSEAFDLVNLNKDNEQSLSDYKDMFKVIGDEVAQKYNIPLDIFYGNKTEKSNSNNDFISYAVDPYYEILEDGFNITLVGKDSYLKGEYVAFNRVSLFYRDIFDNTNGIDKLHANGFSRNEINKFLKLPKINKEWANKHYVTKNYANVEGGEKD